jgi:hypothetical protein
MATGSKAPVLSFACLFRDFEENNEAATKEVEGMELDVVFVLHRNSFQQDKPRRKENKDFVQLLVLSLIITRDLEFYF